jgi:hypothetical protein
MADTRATIDIFGDDSGLDLIRFDDDSVWGSGNTYDSVGGVSPTVHGAPDFERGRFGDGVKMSSTDDYLEYDFQFGELSRFAVSFFSERPDGLAAGARLLWGLDSDGFKVVEDDAVVSILSSDSIDEYMRGLDHYVINFDASSVSVWMNGMPIVTKNDISVTWNNEKFVIGYDGESSSGVVDQVRFFNRTLSAFEIRTLYYEPTYNSSIFDSRRAVADLIVEDFASARNVFASAHATFSSVRDVAELSRDDFSSLRQIETHYEPITIKRIV